MTAEEKKRDYYTLLSLNGDDERWVAYLIAMHWRSGHHKLLGAMLDGLLYDMDGDSTRMLGLVDDALQGKGKFRPRPKRDKIIAAYWAARMAAARTGKGIDVDTFLEEPRTPPTVREVKLQYVRLFVTEQRPPRLTESQWLQELKDEKVIPADHSIVKVLDGLHLPWRKDKPGPHGPWKNATRQIQSLQKAAAVEARRRELDEILKSVKGSKGLRMSTRRKFRN